MSTSLSDEQMLKVAALLLFSVSCSPFSDDGRLRSVITTLANDPARGGADQAAETRLLLKARQVIDETAGAWARTARDAKSLTLDEIRRVLGAMPGLIVAQSGIEVALGALPAAHGETLRGLSG